MADETKDPVAETAPVEKAPDPSELELRKELLTGRIGRLVNYYDEGHRTGYLVALHRTSADIQPLGVFRGGQPRIIGFPMLHVKPTDSTSKYETLEEYIAFMGWDKPKPAPVGHVHNASAPRPALKNGTLVTADQAQLDTASVTGGFWNVERAVELHKSGMKLIDIAVEMGYPRGSGCNRTKAALKKAGAL